MNKELEKVLLKLYGEQMGPYMDDLHKRIVACVAALRYMGEKGDHPLARLNRLFQEDFFK